MLCHDLSNLRTILFVTMIANRQSYAGYMVLILVGALTNFKFIQNLEKSGK